MISIKLCSGALVAVEERHLTIGSLFSLDEAASPMKALAQTKFDADLLRPAKCMHTDVLHMCCMSYSIAVDRCRVCTRWHSRPSFLNIPVTGNQWTSLRPIRMIVHGLCLDRGCLQLWPAGRTNPWAGPECPQPRHGAPPCALARLDRWQAQPPCKDLTSSGHVLMHGRATIPPP